MGFHRALTPLTWSLLALAIGWSYYPAIGELLHRWATDPSYTHGFLVPIFALYLLWHRRELAPHSMRGNWWGLALVGLGILMRLASAYWYYPTLIAYSLIVILAGVSLAAGGWRALRWTGPSVAFLLFMVPLPGRLHGMLGDPLQLVATATSTYVIQVLGVPAIAERNVILLSEATIGVVEACSGLRMLILFFALSTAVALLSGRAIWEKAIIVASAVPIAIAANVARISLTAALHEWVSHEAADAVFHDLAAYLMTPLAIVLLWIELWVLSQAFPVGPADAPLRLDLEN